MVTSLAEPSRNGGTPMTRVVRGRSVLSLNNNRHPHVFSLLLQLSSGCAGRIRISPCSIVGTWPVVEGWLTPWPQTGRGRGWIDDAWRLSSTVSGQRAGGRFQNLNMHLRYLYGVAAGKLLLIRPLLFISTIPSSFGTRISNSSCGTTGIMHI